jgi:hypothetical protein
MFARLQPCSAAGLESFGDLYFRQGPDVSSIASWWNASWIVYAVRPTPIPAGVWLVFLALPASCDDDRNQRIPEGCAVANQRSDEGWTFSNSGCEFGATCLPGRRPGTLNPENATATTAPN